MERYQIILSQLYFCTYCAHFYEYETQHFLLFHKFVIISRINRLVHVHDSEVSNHNADSDFNN